MLSLKTLAAVTMLAFVSACASPGTQNPVAADEHASHHPDATTAATMPAMQERMKAMREMHDKMMNAKTPTERQALMADHMKSMQDGMEMMKGMSGMGAMGPMGDGKGMPAEMFGRHQMMEGRMEMMQMMMEMMMQRMPSPPSAK